MSVALDVEQTRSSTLAPRPLLPVQQPAWVAAMLRNGRPLRMAWIGRIGTTRPADGRDPFQASYDAIDAVEQSKKGDGLAAVPNVPKIEIPLPVDSPFSSWSYQCRTPRPFKPTEPATTPVAANAPPALPVTTTQPRRRLADRKPHA